MPRVDLSIDSVLEGLLGSVTVDDPQHPTVFLLRAGPFCYFAGDPDSQTGQELLRDLPAHLFLMPSAPGWLEAAQAMHASRIFELDRYSFSATTLHFARLQQLAGASSDESNSVKTGSPQIGGGAGWIIRRMDRDFAQQISEQEHFIDLSLFASPEDFEKRGAGFYVEDRRQIAGAAYSALACSRGIEVSVYVRERWRRRGIATATASRLLLWALERGIEPHWDAANPESCKLAMKLGYRFVGSYTAYYLGE